MFTTVTTALTKQTPVLLVTAISISGCSSKGTIRKTKKLGEVFSGWEFGDRKFMAEAVLLFAA